MTRLVQYFHKFWERLIELSNKHIPEVIFSFDLLYLKCNIEHYWLIYMLFLQGLNTTTVSVLSRSLAKLLADPNFGPIMMPTSKLRQLHLPRKGAVMDKHNPFAV